MVRKCASDFFAHNFKEASSKPVPHRVGGEKIQSVLGKTILAAFQSPCEFLKENSLSNATEKHFREFCFAKLGKQRDALRRLSFPQMHAAAQKMILHFKN